VEDVPVYRPALFSLFNSFFLFENFSRFSSIPLTVRDITVSLTTLCCTPGCQSTLSAAGLIFRLRLAGSSTGYDIPFLSQLFSIYRCGHPPPTHRNYFAFFFCLAASGNCLPVSSTYLPESQRCSFYQLSCFFPSLLPRLSIRSFTSSRSLLDGILIIRVDPLLSSFLRSLFPFNLLEGPTFPRHDQPRALF